MQLIQGISRHRLLIGSLEDKITANNPVRFIDAFVSVVEHAAQSLPTLGQPYKTPTKKTASFPKRFFFVNCHSRHSRTLWSAAELIIHCKQKNFPKRTLSLVKRALNSFYRNNTFLILRSN